MRPALLDPLFADAKTLTGVGPKVVELLSRIVPVDVSDRDLRVGDLLFVLPHGLIDRRNRPGIANAAEGAVVTLELRIDRHQPSPRGRSNVPYRIYAHDETGEVSLTFFNARRDWLEKQMPVDETFLVSGKMEWFNGRPSMVHPDHVVPIADAASLPELEPVFPLTAGLSPKVVRKAVAAARERLQELPEWLDEAFMRRHGFPSFGTALQRHHEPRDPLDIALDAPPRRRLAYDEILAGQLALGLVRARVRRASGRPLIGTGKLDAAIRAALPYRLTGAQESALAEIRHDLEQPERMLRLLQGDVGSGKTVVALLAMAQAAEAGGQSALMVPTEVLARQHYSTIAPLAAKAGLRTVILTGRDKGADRKRTLAEIEDGTASIVIGTHALFQENVAFRQLYLAIVDEQHRFGVHQRLAMTSKGDTPDMLVMTATPIPRTLVLTAFGDMDVSRLTEKPAGRKPISTATVPLERIGEMVERMRRAVEEGQKIYWICPLVEESEASELASAQERYEALLPIFGDRVGLVHGRMAGREKNEAMADFKAGRTRVLVGTTVVEVGVDVPDASVIVIEHAERFGLAQLHQLRGRVGRGEAASSCVLLYKAPLGEIAKRRLEIMRETEDGFRIAEEDLKLRGEGELLGTRQSGTPGFRVASLDVHGDLLEAARDDARLVLARDPELQGERGKALRILLYLFGRDDAVRLLRAG
jgi:ATP-dependent DNA helicase RecG